MRFREALAVTRQLAEAARKVVVKLLARRRLPPGGRIEHHDSADVHVRALVRLLELEERRVES